MLIDIKVLQRLLSLYEMERNKKATSFISSTLNKGSAALESSYTLASNFFRAQPLINIPEACSTLKRDLSEHKFPANWVDFLLKLGDLAHQAEQKSSGHFSKFARVLHAMRSYILSRLNAPEIEGKDKTQQIEINTKLTERINTLKEKRCAAKMTALTTLSENDRHSTNQLYRDYLIQLTYLGYNSQDLFLYPEILEKYFSRIEYPDPKICETPPLPKPTASPTTDLTYILNPTFVCMGVPLFLHHTIYYQLYCHQVLYPEANTRAEAFTLFVTSINEQNDTNLSYSGPSGSSSSSKLSVSK